MTQFPRVRPLPTLTPWSTPQSIEAVPDVRAIRPAIASGAVAQAKQATATREPHRYAQVNGSVIYSVTTAESSLIIPAPQNFRNFLMMRCTAGAVFVDFGREASRNAPLYLAANSIVLFDTVVPQDDIYALSDSGTSTISIAFGNINFLEPVT